MERVREAMQLCLEIPSDNGETHDKAPKIFGQGNNHSTTIVK